MNGKIRRLLHTLLLPLLFAVLLVPKQVFAEGYSCSTSIPTEVAVSGEKIPEGIEYKVVLEAVTKDAPMPEKTSLVIKDGGKAQFGPMTYTVPGDYQYKVYQEDGKADRFTYDKAVYTVTVRVVNDENGGLRSEMWAVKGDSTEKTDKVGFANSYKAPDSPKKHHHSSGSSDPAPQAPTGLASPQTGDSSNIALWAGLAAAALAAVIVLFCRKHRRREEA